MPFHLSALSHPTVKSPTESWDLIGGMERPNWGVYVNTCRFMRPMMLCGTDWVADPPVVSPLIIRLAGLDVKAEVPLLALT